ncbi:hypothetical protein ES703_98737 [subsurface metagenome]
MRQIRNINPGCRLLEQVKRAMRTRNYSPRTITICIQWIKRFILFHNKTRSADMGKEEVRSFLTYLAVEKNVAPSTQNQTLQALLFLYRDVLESPAGWIDNILRPSRPLHLPLKSYRMTLPRHAFLPLP